MELLVQPQGIINGNINDQGKIMCGYNTYKQPRFLMQSLFAVVYLEN